MSHPRQLDTPLYRLLHDEKISEFNKQKPQVGSINLRGADLRGLDLRLLDASRVDFADAYFRGADLRGIDLREAGGGWRMARDSNPRSMRLSCLPA